LPVKLPPQSVRDWLGRAKKHATFAIRARGWKGKVWALRGKFIPVRSRKQQVNTYRYIIRHGSNGAWIGVWKEDRLEK
jgi:hypothetical protein